MPAVKQVKLIELDLAEEFCKMEDLGSADSNNSQINIRARARVSGGAAAR